jgi:hypothetical protein
LAKWFQRIFLEIDQSETRIACGKHLWKVLVLFFYFWEKKELKSFMHNITPHACYNISPGNGGHFILTPSLLNGA